VFLTGHTGFKGAWMSLWLQQMGAKVTGYLLAPHTEPNMFDLAGKYLSHIADIRDEGKVRDALMASDPQVVIHMAAQALVNAGPPVHESLAWTADWH
jgi:CDP-glucose 4,6-dehydratase